MSFLYKVQISDLANATVRFNEHGFKSQRHKNATVRAAQLCEYMESRRVSIYLVLNSKSMSKCKLTEKANSNRRGYGTVWTPKYFLARP